MTAALPGDAPRGASTTAPRPPPRRTGSPPRPNEKKRTGSRDYGESPEGPSKFEYLCDEDARLDAKQFHILLLGETFAQPRMSVAYAAGALTLVLAMPEPVATEHAAFAAEHLYSCLGAWDRDECLTYAQQLDARDIVVRVVPGVRGRSFWQGDAANTDEYPEDKQLEGPPGRK